MNTTPKPRATKKSRGELVGPVPPPPPPPPPLFDGVGEGPAVVVVGEAMIEVTEDEGPGASRRSNSTLFLLALPARRAYAFSTAA